MPDYDDSLDAYNLEIVDRYQDNYDEKGYDYVMWIFTVKGSQEDIESACASLWFITDMDEIEEYQDTESEDDEDIDDID